MIYWSQVLKFIAKSNIYFVRKNGWIQFTIKQTSELQWPLPHRHFLLSGWSAPDNHGPQQQTVASRVRVPGSGDGDTLQPATAGTDSREVWLCMCTCKLWRGRSSPASTITGHVQTQQWPPWPRSQADKLASALRLTCPH